MSAALPLAVLALAAPGQAAEPVFPPDAICVDGNAPRERAVEPLQLTRWLIAAAKVSDAALDANGDGDTLLAEKQLALVQPDYCAAPERRCSAEDRAALESLNQRLAQFAKQAGGPGYAMARRRRPTPPERIAQAALTERLEVPGQSFQAGEILDPAGRYVRVACLEPAAPQIAEGGVAESAKPPPRPYWVLNPNGTGGFRLTGEIDDLPKTRAKLGSVRPAELSITSDLRNNLKTYQAKAVTGYEVVLQRGDALQTSLIPFMLYERLLDNDLDEADEIDKVGFGVQEAITVNLADYAKNEFAITPLYLTDSNFESDVGLLKLRWTPTMGQSTGMPVGFRRQFGPALVQFDLDALADIGRVFDPGDNVDLDDEDEFFRVGGRLGVQLRGAPGTYFDQIELLVSNKYLTNIDSDIEDLWRIDSSISYLFPDAEHYRLSFAYVTGRTDDTLQLTEYWKTQFGVRF
jgi:hypothetical protein